LMLSNIQVKENLLADEKYQFLFSVEEVNKLVLQGMPFRDAYKKIGMDIEQGNYHPQKTVNHTHEGSIGNLCNDQIQRMMNTAIEQFSFSKVNSALENLIK
jgi:argininosuccinate lyase